jgi:hypothetical protein
MKIQCFDDITGDGAKHRLITLLKVGGVLVTQANWATKWFQLVMTTSSGVTRVGDSNVSATNGISVGTPNNGQFAPVDSAFTEVYHLDDIWVIIKSGDVMSVARTI